MTDTTLVQCDNVRLNNNLWTVCNSIHKITFVQTDPLEDPFILSWACNGEVGRHVRISRENDAAKQKLYFCEVTLRGHVISFSKALPYAARLGCKKIWTFLSFRCQVQWWVLDNNRSSIWSCHQQQPRWSVWSQLAKGKEKITIYCLQSLNIQCALHAYSMIDKHRCRWKRLIPLRVSK